jgi:type IV secretory pathway TrbD component
MAISFRVSTRGVRERAKNSTGKIAGRYFPRIRHCPGGGAMSFRKSCPRTLDRPIMIFGLEPEDLVLVGLVSGLILFAIDAIPAVLTGAVLWIGLSRLKAGKPPGYVFELMYRSGLLRWAPSFLKAPHLVRRGVKHLDAFAGGDDDVVAEYWSDRPRMDP